MELIFDNVHYSYEKNGRMALAGVSLSFHRGERIALIGRNGCGKSTLMLHANGILRPQQGELSLDGQLVRYDRQSLIHLRQTVGIVFQNPEEQLFSASVLQDLSFGPLNLGLSEDEVRNRVNQVASLCELTPLLDRPTHALSGGEKTRAALAGVLAMEPSFLFADEIMNSLDPWMRNQILKILAQWVDSGRTVVLSTHDWNMALRWANRIIWLDGGRVYREGQGEEIFMGQDIPEGILG